MAKGHGHVIPNEDGTKARCGGPALCSVCARELSAQFNKVGPRPEGKPYTGPDVPDSDPFDPVDEDGKWEVGRDDDSPEMVCLTATEGKKKSVMYLPPMDALELAMALTAHARDILEGN